MLRFRITTTLWALLHVGLGAHLAWGQFAELARQVPSSANAVAFVNVEKLMESSVAKREGWAAKRDASFGAGLTLLPPEGKYAVLANQVDLSVWVPLWEAAILELDHEPSAAKVAGMTGGQLDNVAGHEAVALPGDAYFIRTGAKMAAFMAPANRQSVARWLREVEARREHGLSPYLAEAFRFANDLGTPVILALDLEDAVTSDAIQELLAQSDAKEFLAKNKLETDSLLSMLVGIRGITLGVTFADKPFGKIKVDFRNDVALSAESAKLVLLHALAKRGAMIDEFSEWKSAVSGKQVTLEGHLTSSGMRRLSSLFDRPPSLTPTQSPPPQQSQSKSQQMAQTSQAYFKNVTELLDDLSQERKKNSSYTMAQIGVWMDKYAKKIDQLSVLNVDPAVVDYGAYVADALRAGYGAIRTGAARSRIRQVDTPMQYNTYGYQSNYGFTYREGYVNVPDPRAYQQERTRVRTEERVASAQSARDIMKQIDDATADIRRKMTQKYQINF